MGYVLQGRDDIKRRKLLKVAKCKRYFFELTQIYMNSIWSMKQESCKVDSENDSPVRVRRAVEMFAMPSPSCLKFNVYDIFVAKQSFAVWRGVKTKSAASP